MTTYDDIIEALNELEKAGDIDNLEEVQHQCEIRINALRESLEED